MAKQVFEMSFAEFAESVKPSGAVNRFPSIGAGKDVFSYSVYMNGPLLNALPERLREHEFKDVMVHALTEKLQLNPESFRDNLKVAELVAVRSTWMSAVLENSRDISNGMSQQVMDDYELLTNGLSHPWIKQELAKQQALTAKLQPTLDRAGLQLGTNVIDGAPDEISVGKVVLQNTDFTVQKTNEGRVVTHENRRLKELPSVGSEVSVSYYRGSGQVVDSLENVKVSQPFVEPQSGDLAVMLKDGRGKEQVILFNSVGSIDKFVKAHGMDQGIVRAAMDLRQAQPKPLAPLTSKEKVSDIYIDGESGCLSLDYKEKGVTYSAMFTSAKAMESLAKEFSLTPQDIAMGKQLEARYGGLSTSLVKDSEASLRKDLQRLGFTEIQTAGGDRAYVGKVVADGPAHVAQDIGRKVAVIHDLRNLDKVAVVGDTLTVKYENDRGRVINMVRDSQGLGR
ncbi:MAG TPA: hypothetical protein VJ654_12765 [Noviherbaspirillum sp.]|nr:hypothetical protein [Noviherbaspirillum sp.]